jgi:hypothetical protein
MEDQSKQRTSNDVVIERAEEFVSLRRSKRREDYLRAATASANTEVWLDVIKRLPDMRVWVAHNKAVPIEVLSVLARDPDPDVRLAVAMKNKLSEELFSLLAKDVSDSVRARIARNKKTPIEILQQLAKDPCEIVSRQSSERVKRRK